jgi:hypothetical protein
LYSYFLSKSYEYLFIAPTIFSIYKTYDNDSQWSCRFERLMNITSKNCSLCSTSFCKPDNGHFPQQQLIWRLTIISKHLRTDYYWSLWKYMSQRTKHQTTCTTYFCMYIWISTNKHSTNSLPISTSHHFVNNISKKSLLLFFFFQKDKWGRLIVAKSLRTDGY